MEKRTERGPIEIDIEMFRKLTGREPSTVVRVPRSKRATKVCTCRGSIPEHRGRCR